MQNESSGVNYWALSFRHLAEYCSSVAGNSAPDSDPQVRAEAARVYSAWQESLALPEEGFDNGARRAAQLAALRKRTIQMLVRANPDPVGKPSY
jgi:hypothetical protein